MASERPILFSGPMVRAILDGRKTQTRRALTRENVEVLGSRWARKSPWEGLRFAEAEVRQHSARDLYLPFCHPADEPTPSEECGIYRLSPLVEAGNRLWVRESLHRDPDIWKYKADGAVVGWPERQALASKWLDYAPSIYMPKAASRLTLLVTDVRVQRLQDISADDAEAEGVFRHVAEHSLEKVFRDKRGETAVQYFRELWDGLNAKRGFGWDANPWIVAITFTVERPNGK